MPVRPACIVLPTEATRARWTTAYAASLAVLHDRDTLHSWWTAAALGTATEGRKATAKALADDLARWDALTLAEPVRTLPALTAQAAGEADAAEERVRASTVRTWWVGVAVTAEGPCPLSQLLHSDHYWSPSEAGCRYCALPDPQGLCSGCLRFPQEHPAVECAEPVAA